MNEIASILATLAPVFALVALGAGLRWADFPGAEFWPLAERFTYYLLFPVLLVLKISTATLPQQGLGQVVLALLLALLLMVLVSLLLAKLLDLSMPAKSSLFQGGIRFNTYVGLAAAAALFGEQGILWGALFLGLMIPLINIACVSVFILSGGSGPGRWRGLLLPLLKNPLIIGCLLGGALNLSGAGMPSPLIPVLELLSTMALPLGLLAVGVGLNLKAMRGGGGALWGSCLLKLLLYPLCFALLARLFALPPEAVAVLLIFVSLPTAPSAYILARQMGGDAPLMAAIITLQTLLAAVTMPLVMHLLG
ncbi:MAG: malonate transporter [Motiliproteus sp.]|jgi:malonate transporter